MKNVLDCYYLIDLTIMLQIYGTCLGTFYQPNRLIYEFNQN